MNKLKHYSFLLVCVTACMAATAQDLLYVKGQKAPLKVKVTAIGDDDISYLSWPLTDEATAQVIAKDGLRKLVMENGESYLFSDEPLVDPGNDYMGQSRYAVKFNMFTTLVNHSVFTLEKSVRPYRSIEASVGVIGWGIRILPGYSSGAFGRFGYKFIIPAYTYSSNSANEHILEGLYIKPEIVFGGYKEQYKTDGLFTSKTYHRDVAFGALMVNIGAQWVMYDRLALDVFCGIGAGTSNYSKKGTYADGHGSEIYHYAFAGGLDGAPLAVSAGIRLGYAFGRQPFPVQN